MRPAVCSCGDDIDGLCPVNGRDLGGTAGVGGFARRYRRTVQARTMGKVDGAAWVEVACERRVAITPNSSLNRTGRHAASADRALARPAG